MLTLASPKAGASWASSSAMVPRRARLPSLICSIFEGSRSHPQFRHMGAPRLDDSEPTLLDVVGGTEVRPSGPRSAAHGRALLATDSSSWRSEESRSHAVA